LLGSNVPTIGGIHTGFKWGSDWKCESIQIYLTLSRRWDVPQLSIERIKQFKNEWKKSSIKKVVAHIPFLVNLASADKDIHKKSCLRLNIEYNLACELGVSFLVLHPGSYRNSNKEDGMQRIIESLNLFCQKNKYSKTKILLETMAGQGNTIGSSFEEIAHILENIETPKILGVCFDTAHVFISGYDIRGYEGYKMITDEFDIIIGLDKIMVIHLNDAKTDLGSKNDRHANIRDGKLGLQVFHAILRDRRFYKVPKILEIPERDKRSKDDLDFLRSLEIISDPIHEKKEMIKQLNFKDVF
jgi:deoxyribonuclease IV